MTCSRSLRNATDDEQPHLLPAGQTLSGRSRDQHTFDLPKLLDASAQNLHVFAPQTHAEMRLVEPAMLAGAGLADDTTGHAVEATWELTTKIRFNLDQDLLNEDTNPLVFNKGLIGGALLGGFELDVEWHSQFETYIELDLGEVLLGMRRTGDQQLFRVEFNSSTLNPQPDEGVFDILEFLLSESFMIRELYATAYFNEDLWIGMKIGMLNLTLGKAALYDNYALGMRFIVDVSERSKNALPIRWIFDAFLPDSSFTTAAKTSPVLNTSIEYLFDDDHSVGLFATYLYDGNGLAGQLLQPIFRDSVMVQLEDVYRKTFRRAPNADIECISEAVRPESVDQPHALVKSAHIAAYERLQQCESGAAECTDKQIQSLRDTLAVQVEVDALQREFQKRVQNLPQGRRPPVSPRSHYLNACTGAMESQGHHLWIGAEGNWKWKGFSIEGSLIFYTSRMSLILSRDPNTSRYLNRSRQQRTPSRFRNTRRSLVTHQQTGDDLPTVQQDLNLNGLGFSANIKATYDWHPMFSTSLFFVFTSGDNIKVQNNGTINAFMGLAPQLRYTNIFFNGGINADSSQRNISISGLTGRGVITPGLILRFHIDKKESKTGAKKKPKATTSKKLNRKKISKLTKQRRKAIKKALCKAAKEAANKKAAQPKTKQDAPNKTSPTPQKAAKSTSKPVSKPASRKAAKDDDDDDDDDDDEETVTVVEVLIKTAPIWSQAPALASNRQGVGNFYGFEVDLEATYRFNRWVSAAMELDFFMPGNFFAEGNPPPFVMTFLVGLNFTFK